VLWDKEERRIVSNESQDIVRMLNSDFNAVAEHPELDLYPEDLRADVLQALDAAMRDGAAGKLNGVANGNGA